MTALSTLARRRLEVAMGSTRAADEIADVLEVSNVLSAAEAAFLDSVVAGTAAASKAVVLDANKDVASVRDLTVRNAICGAAGTIAGSVQIAGVTSGVVTIKTNDVAGTWTFKVPAAVGSAGQQLTDAGGDGVSSWAAAGSLREFKEVVAEVSGECSEALAKLLNVGVYAFTYKPDAQMTTGDHKTQYTGVLGDELPEVMHFDGKIFSPVSAFGMAVLAIKALAAEVESLKAQLAKAPQPTAT